jgi:hypothetical protein
MVYFETAVTQGRVVPGKIANLPEATELVMKHQIVLNGIGNLPI